MKRATLVGAAGTALLLAAFVFTSHTPAQQPDAKKVQKLDTFMQAKLRHAQEVLQGLVLEDYDRISKNAQKISLLSLESNWNVLQTEEYLERSVDFRQSTDKLAREAKKKNLDGATLAYVEMTLNCINCHKYVRAAKYGRRNR